MTIGKSICILLAVVGLSFGQPTDTSFKASQTDSNPLQTNHSPKALNDANTNGDSHPVNIFLPKSKVVVSDDNLQVYAILKDVFLPIAMFILGFLSHLVILTVQRRWERLSVEKMLLIELKLNYQHINGIAPCRADEPLFPGGIKLIAEGHGRITTSIRDAFLARLSLLSIRKLEDVVLAYRSTEQYVGFSKDLLSNSREIGELLSRKGLAGSVQSNLEVLPENAKADLETNQMAMVMAIVKLREAMSKAIESLGDKVFLMAEESNRSRVLRHFNQP